MTVEPASTTARRDHLDRARVLFEQGRLDLAEPELRSLLAAHPDMPEAHALLAMCHSRAKRHKDALREADIAVALAPDMAFAHYVRGGVLLEAGRLDQAVGSAQEALRIDPDEPDFHVLLAGLRIEQGRARDGLRAAEDALRLDPESVDALSMRQTALVQLGRREEASSASDAALARDPEDAMAHANRGWLLLQRRQVPEAMSAFSEALRLDPTLDRARVGLVEGMKARNPVYGLLLRYVFFMQRLGPKQQFMLLFGMYALSRIPVQLARRNSDLAPLMTPLIALYMAFVLMTWFAGPLANLVLQLDRAGRLALSPDELRESRVIGAFLLVGIVCGALGVITGIGAFLLAAIGAFASAIPLTAAFNSRPGWPRTLMGGITVLVAVSCAIATFLSASAGAVGLFDYEPAIAFFATGVVLAVLSSWIGTIVTSLRPARG